MLKRLGKTITNNFSLKILAVILAVVLWVVVINIDDPTTSKTYTTNVVAENTDYITSQNKYYEPLDSSNVVSFRVSAARSVHDELSNADFSATADMENIEYDITRRQLGYDADILDEIVDIMVDTVCSTKHMIRIGGQDFPLEVVKSRLLKLNSEHISYVVSSLKSNTTKVRNIRAYLLTALYNAPTTISSYYTALVNHDLYGGE